MNPEKYTVTNSKKADQGRKSPRLASGYMGQQIPLRLGRMVMCPALVQCALTSECRDKYVCV